MAIAALSALGAGSAKQTVQRDSDPSITVYNQGVELMLAKKFPEAQAKFEQAVKENPGFDYHSGLLTIWCGPENSELPRSRSRTRTTTRTIAPRAMLKRAFKRRPAKHLAFGRAGR